MLDLDGTTLMEPSRPAGEARSCTSRKLGTPASRLWGPSADEQRRCLSWMENVAQFGLKSLPVPRCPLPAPYFFAVCALLRTNLSLSHVLVRLWTSRFEVHAPLLCLFTVIPACRTDFFTSRSARWQLLSPALLELNGAVRCQDLVL
jgi:hypothetical protein